MAVDGNSERTGLGFLLAWLVGWFLVLGFMGVVVFSVAFSAAFRHGLLFWRGGSTTRSTIIYHRKILW